MNRIMVDLETLGNRPGSVIVAIGAVRFGDGEIKDRLYTRINPESCVETGLKMDASTVVWWMDKSDAARAVFKPGGVHIMVALQDFSTWSGGVGMPKEIWGNGATFDNVLLSEAYLCANIRKPLTHKEDRCYRTMCALRPDVQFVPVGTHHNAVDDAESQALHLMKIEEAMRIADTSPRPSPQSGDGEEGGRSATRPTFGEGEEGPRVATSPTTGGAR